MYDKAIKYLPLLTILVFLLGYAYQASYYKAFNVDILVYENTSEVLYTLLPLSILIFGSAIVLITDKKKYNVSQPPEREIKKYRKLKGRFLLIILMVIVLILDFFLRKKLGPLRMQPVIDLAFYLILIASLVYSHLVEFINTKIIKTTNVIILVILAGFLVMKYARSKAETMKELGNENKYTIYSKAMCLITDKEFFVVGETQGFIFLYRTIDSTTHIINRVEIDSIKIKSNR